MVHCKEDKRMVIVLDNLCHLGTLHLQHVLS